MNNIPRGIDILALLYFLQGAGGILYFFIIAFYKMDLMTLFILTAAISHIIIAYGLTKAKIWAWYGAILISIISIIGYTINMMFYKMGYFQGSIWIGIALIIIYYLLRPNVKEYFFKKKLLKSY